MVCIDEVRCVGSNLVAQTHRHVLLLFGSILSRVNSAGLLLNALLEDFEMFRVRHCHVTSLASAMRGMILDGHTVSDSHRRVNAEQELNLPLISQRASIANEIG